MAKTLATPISSTTRPSSVDNKNSRYVHGGVTTTYSKRLGWWDQTIIEKRQDDEDFYVSGKYVGRPDLIAYEQWGKASLAWLVLQYNNIVDPSEELVEGTLLALPPYTRVVTSILTKSTGGKKA